MKTRLAITSVLAAVALSVTAEEMTPQAQNEILRECGHINCPTKKKPAQTNEAGALRARLKMTAEERKAKGEAWALKKSNELKMQGISDFTKAVSWEANTATNDLKILVCTEVLPRGECRDLLFREFHFSKDGRLLSVSPIKKWATARTIGRTCHYE